MMSTVPLSFILSHQARGEKTALSSVLSRKLKEVNDTISL
jgi:hypothetical protein